MKKILTISFLIISSCLTAQNRGFNTLKHGVSINTITSSLNVVKSNKTDAKVNPIKDFKYPNAFRENIRNAPLKNYKITSHYGYRIHPISGIKKFHSGIDLISYDDNIYSIGNGIVKKVYFSKKCGVKIVIIHNNYEAIYCHLDKVYIKTGQKVYANDIIGIIGSTGAVTGKHLHFSLKKDNKYINPISFLNQTDEY